MSNRLRLQSFIPTFLYFWLFASYSFMWRQIVTLVLSYFILLLALIINCSDCIKVLLDSFHTFPNTMNNSLIGSDRKMVPWMQTNEPLPFDPALNILNLGEFITILLLHGTALLMIGLIVKQKSFSEISRPLLILLFNWFLCALFLIPYEFFLLITWESDSGCSFNINFQKYPNTLASKFGITLFFLGLPGFLLMSAIPISVMFVTLDRICITHFGAG